MTVGDRIKDESEKIKLNYTIGKHPEIDGRIVIAFDNTGLDVDNKEHLHFLDIISKVIASQMYAKANNIPMENVVY